jgi:hypothetical protein
MTKILMAVAFATSFMIMFLGVLLMIHLDLLTGFLVSSVGCVYFFKYLPSTKSNNNWR